MAFKEQSINLNCLVLGSVSFDLNANYDEM